MPENSCTKEVEEQKFYRDSSSYSNGKYILPDTEIDDKFFNYSKRIQKIIMLPDPFESPNAKYAIFPKTFREMEDFSFVQFPVETEIIVSAAVNTIPSFSFSNCPNIKSITFCAPSVELGDGVFTRSNIKEILVFYPKVALYLQANAGRLGLNPDCKITTVIPEYTTENVLQPEEMNAKQLAAENGNAQNSNNQVKRSSSVSSSSNQQKQQTLKQ